MIRPTTERARRWLLRNVVLPSGDVAFQQGMMRRLRYLEAAQWWDRERLHRQRDRLLADVVRTAFDEVPFYRDLLTEHGVTPREIRSPDDLPKLPVVTKAMLRSGYPDRVTRRTGYKTYVAASSGSTGTNFYVLEDAPTAGWYRATTLMVFQWAGWHIGDRHMQAGMTTRRSLDRRLKDRLLGCHYISAADLSDDALDRHLSVLEQARIEHLWGYPGSLYLLARRALAQGWNRPLRSVVTWGDMLYPHYRRTIEHAFRTRVYDTYGCGEGIQISAQCGADDSYHIHGLDVIVETVDDLGQPVAAGEPGHVVLTRLHAGPMPLIRYRIGDVATLAGSVECRCGRGFDRMHSIQGRDTDVVLTPSGNRLIVHFFTGIIEHFSEIDTFQVVQTAPDSIVIRIVPAMGFTSSVSERLISVLKDRGAASLHIEVEPVREIPLPASGKRRFVISEHARSQLAEPVRSPVPGERAGVPIAPR